MEREREMDSVLVDPCRRVSLLISLLCDFLARRLFLYEVVFQLSVVDM